MELISFIISSIMAGMFPMTEAGKSFLKSKGEDVYETTMDSLNYIVRQSLELHECLVSKVMEKGCNKPMFKKLVSLGYLEIEEAAEWTKVKLGPTVVNAFEGTAYADLIKGRMVAKLLPPKKVAQSSLEMKLGNGILDASQIDRPGFRGVGMMGFGFSSKSIHSHMDALISKAMEWEKSCNNIFKINVSEEAVKTSLEQICHGTDWSCGIVHLCGRGRGYWSENSGLISPKTNKLLRACIRTPFSVKLTAEGIDNVCAFVAELNGISLRGRTWRERICEGRRLWDNHIFKVSENSFEHMWLERIYEGDVNHWDIPIEIDATASMMQIYGALLGSEYLLKSTNVIQDESGILNDAWYVEGLPRPLVKTTMTPMGYGRSKENALKAIGSIDLRLKAIEFLNRAGVKAFVEFKDYIVAQVKPAARMHIKIWNDEWDIVPNHFLDGNGCPKVVDKLHTEHKEVTYFDGLNWRKGIQHIVAYMPDLEHFKLYFPSLIIHNLDSQIADRVCQENRWVLPNHDAFIVHPNDANKVRKSYITALHEVYDNRVQILTEYGKCIGIKDLAKFAQELPEGTEFCLTALK